MLAQFTYLAAIFVYDYILTFGEEIDRFWTKPRLSWTFAFFIANRYLTLLGRIPAFVANFLQVDGGPYSSVRATTVKDLDV